MLYAYCIARDESWRVFQQNPAKADLGPLANIRRECAAYLPFSR